MHDSKIQSRLKAQLTKFCTELCTDLSRPLEKFANQMLFGIQASQDVKLSNIARSLKEEIPLIETEKRLSRNLKAAELEKELTPQLVRMGSQRVRPNTVLALDLSDIRKEYAQKMEYLATVRDGSTGELHQGYWLCDVTAAEVNGSEIVPLYQKLYLGRGAGLPQRERRNAGRRRSDPERTPRGAGSGRSIAAAIARSCWNPCWIGPSASSSAPRASARSSTDRTLPGSVAEVAGRCRLPHQARIVKIQDGQEKIYELRYGAEPIQSAGSHARNSGWW